GSEERNPAGRDPGWHAVRRSFRRHAAGRGDLFIPGTWKSHGQSNADRGSVCDHGCGTYLLRHDAAVQFSSRCSRIPAQSEAEERLMFKSFRASHLGLVLGGLIVALIIICGLFAPWL